MNAETGRVAAWREEKAKGGAEEAAGKENAEKGEEGERGGGAV